MLEPGTGLTGKLKTARKGVGDYTVRVRGRASHAGVDFATGASAVLELARQVDRIAAFTEPGEGHHGESGGGPRRNAQQRGGGGGRAEMDIRVLKLRDAPALEKRFARSSHSINAAGLK